MACALSPLQPPAPLVHIAPYLLMYSFLVKDAKAVPHSLGTLCKRLITANKAATVNALHVDSRDLRAASRLAHTAATIILQSYRLKHNMHVRLTLDCAAGALEAAARPVNEGMLPDGQPATRQAEAKLSATAQFQMEATLQKDAFLVLRALCKLSVRASETATGTDMTAIRGKVSVQASLLHARRKNGQQCSSVCVSGWPYSLHKAIHKAHCHPCIAVPFHVCCW